MIHVTTRQYEASHGHQPRQPRQLNTTQIYVHLGKQNARKIMQDTNL